MLGGSVSSIKGYRGDVVVRGDSDRVLEPIKEQQREPSEGQSNARDIMPCFPMMADTERI